MVAALATSPLWYRKLFYRLEEELRARVEANLAERIPHLEVHVRAARLAADGIEVRGLSISERGAAGPQSELAYLDEVFITCSSQELMRGELNYSAVRISRPVIRATRRPDGTYSLSKLFPLPKPPDPPPTTTIENGTIEIFDPLKNPSGRFVLRDVSATIGPAEAYDPQQPKLAVQGSLAADQIRRAKLTGTIDPKSGNWSFSGSVSGLEISPELRAALPEPIAERLVRLASLRAPADLTFKIAGHGGERPSFEVDGSVARGRIEDARLPYPLTDVKGKFHCNAAGFSIADLSARDGQTIWEIKKYEQQGYAEGSPFVLRASGRQVHLDDKWAGTLPDPWSKYWHYYNPTGDINLDCTLVFDGQEYKPTVDATCLGNVSYRFHKFPYLLERSRGTLRMRDKEMTVAMTSYSGPQPVAIVGKFLNPGRRFTGWVEIRADKIALDDELFAAVVKRESRETLVGLSPRGTINVFARLWRDNPDIPGMQKYARVALDRSNRCSITHEKFPYPLSNLEGTIELKDGQWAFHNLVGTNGPGVVTLTGVVSTLPGADRMNVTINANNVPLVEDLRNALQPRMRQLWDSLQPNGKIDATASVRLGANQQKASVSVRAFPRDDATSLGTSIEPVTFPYRMRLAGGRIDYHDGHADLHEIDAVHGKTHLRTEGSCDIRPDGGWQLQLRNLTVDRLRLHGEDHELTAALPTALRRAVTELKPGGTINLKGNVDFAKLRPGAPLHTGWNVDLVLHQGSLQVGPSLENIFGRVRLRGTANGPHYSSAGELDLDSLTFKNFQFTEITGPLWFDNTNVYLGAWGPTTAPANTAKPRVTAKLLGGTLAGDCRVQLGTVPQYHLVAMLSQAKLEQFARENLASGKKLKGKIAAGVELFGTSGARNFSGSGTIHLSDADVYQLPVMISLLKIARAKPPDATAFTQSDISFDIQQGEHIILKQINLHGDAIDLTGHGELTMDGHTNPIWLRLHASGGRGGFPLVSGMLSEASQQILLIHVGGTLEHPITRTEPFPVANQALQQIGVDSNKPSLFGDSGFMRALGLSR